MTAACDAPVRVVYAADENYAMPLAASMRSLVEHAADLSRTRVTVLTTRFGQAALDRVRRSCPEIEPEVLRVPESALRDLPELEHWSATPYLRLLVSSLFPDDGRLLLLDADTIVLADLADLVATPLDGRPLGAVHDPVMPRFDTKPEAARWVAMGVRRSTPYFNAGAVLVDLAACREQGVLTGALDYVRRYRDEIENPEEEALNVVLKGNWQRLAPEWNVLTVVVGALVVARKLGLRYPLPEEYVRAARHPKVVHFAGADKPWSAPTGRGPLSNLFYRYLDRTDWRGWRPA